MVHIIEKIYLDDVLNLRKDRFNSNNHSKIVPHDYYEVLSRGNISLWIDKFRDNYIVINLRNNDLVWMKKAHDIGKYTGQFPNMFNEELEELLSNYRYLDYIFNSNIKYFVRTERCSLKYGKYGPGPYTSLRQIIESIVTCIDSHSPLHP